jgi:two-component system sensor histidine kinase KdpD
MKQGQLRVYIGAAAGAGTTFAMLDEALRRKSRGTHVAIGWVDTHSRVNTLDLLEKVADSATCPESLNVEFIISQQPDVVLVDDLGRNSGNTFHWELVEELLKSGIDVIATLNVQHIASLAEPVGEIIGAQPDGRVPDDFLRRASQIEIVDITPQAIRRRLAHGNVFDSHEYNPKDSEIFNSDSFAQLRLLMIQWMNSRLMNENEKNAASREVIIVAIGNDKQAAHLLRRSARIAHQTNSQLIGLHVLFPGQQPNHESRNVRKQLTEELGGRYVEITSSDIPGALITFAESEGASQIVIGSPGNGRMSRIQRPTLATELLGRQSLIEICLIPTQQVTNRWKASERRHNSSLLRNVSGVIIGISILALMTRFFVGIRSDISVATSLSLYLLAVVGITAIGGRWPGLVTAVCAPMLANWFLIPPYHTLLVNQRANLVELAVFISTAFIVSVFVSNAEKQTNKADEAWREASTLSALTDSDAIDPTEDILKLLMISFNLEGVTLTDTTDITPHVIFSIGNGTDTSDQATNIAIPVNQSTMLFGKGNPLSPDDHRLLHAFVGQLNRALEQTQLREIAMEATSLARADELRTAILRAVSHDLRSPLSSIKASVSSLRQTDVEWPEDTKQDFLHAIESETDRLTRIVANLLDLSRIESGVLRPVLRPISLEEVIPAVVYEIGPDHSDIHLEIDSELDEVVADPALLERAIANILGNALLWSPSPDSVAIFAHQKDDTAHIHIVDRGPGIPVDQQLSVLQPFHRLGDSSVGGGLGLGLAIADRLIASMNGRLELRDTPGGGLTAVVTLPCSKKEES